MDVVESSRPPLRRLVDMLAIDDWIYRDAHYLVADMEVDAKAAAREGWDPSPPHVDIEGGFFFSADTIEDLAAKIAMKYQRVPMPPANLAATVDRYNSFVESGIDADFDKPKL